MMPIIRRCPTEPVKRRSLAPPDARHLVPALFAALLACSSLSPDVSSATGSGGGGGATTATSSGTGGGSSEPGTGSLPPGPAPTAPPTARGPDPTCQLSAPTPQLRYTADPNGTPGRRHASDGSPCTTGRGGPIGAGRLAGTSSPRRELLHSARGDAMGAACGRDGDAVLPGRPAPDVLRGGRPGGVRRGERLPGGAVLDLVHRGGRLHRRHRRTALRRPRGRPRLRERLRQLAVRRRRWSSSPELSLLLPPHPLLVLPPAQPAPAPVPRRGGSVPLLRLLLLLVHAPPGAGRASTPPRAGQGDRPACADAAPSSVPGGRTTYPRAARAGGGVGEMSSGGSRRRDARAGRGVRRLPGGGRAGVHAPRRGGASAPRAPVFPKRLPRARAEEEGFGDLAAESADRMGALPRRRSAKLHHARRPRSQLVEELRPSASRGPGAPGSGRSRC